MSNMPAANEKNDGDRLVPLPLRSDTFLGVCEGLGEEFGFNPNWARVSLAVMLFFHPVAVIVGYLATGVVLAAARWFLPAARVERADASTDVPQAANSEAEEKLAA